MMGQQTRTESLFYYFRLEDQIPEDHLLRLIDQHVDLSFVREGMGRFRINIHHQRGAANRPSPARHGISPRAAPAPPGASATAVVPSP